MVTCSHCHKNTAVHHYLYADTRGAPRDFPLLTVNPDIPVGLCDDCDKLFDDQTRIDVVYEVLAERLKSHLEKDLYEGQKGRRP